jgi:uncharacterized membrane protein
MLPVFATVTLPDTGFDISDVITALALPIGSALTAVVVFGVAVLIISIAWKWLKGASKSR